MPIQYHIREMQRKDLEEVTALEASCFSRPWSYRDFEEALTNPDRFYLVAEADKPAPDAPDRIIGGCMLTNTAGEGDISNVAVSEKYRNNQIATELMARLIKLGTERYGITVFTLEVRSRNAAAVRLYGKCGFVSVGIRPNFYDRPGDDAVMMKYWGRTLPHPIERTGDSYT